VDWDEALQTKLAQLRSMLECRESGLHPDDERAIDYVVQRRDLDAESKVQALIMLCNYVIALPEEPEREYRPRQSTPERAAVDAEYESQMNSDGLRAKQLKRKPKQRKGGEGEKTPRRRRDLRLARVGGKGRRPRPPETSLGSACGRGEARNEIIPDTHSPLGA
jgi:hypothetical protein